MLSLEHDGNIAVLRLDDGKANAIGPSLLAAFDQRLDEIEASGARALVLTGRPGFFSGGLDLKLLPTLPAAEMRSASLGFVALVERLFLFPKPVVAASAGHALAGGFLLYCAADLRVALDDERSRYGLNEIEAGIPLFGPTLAVALEALPAIARVETVLHGKRWRARDAAHAGLVSDLVPAASAGESSAGVPPTLGLERVVERAVDRARDLERLDLPAYATTKLALRRDAIVRAKTIGEELAARAPRGNVLARLQR